MTSSNPKVELAIALVKGAVSAIPVAGGVIAEVGSLYLNPLERRKHRWAQDVSIAIEDIQRRFSRLPESLESDERFISFLYQATILAYKNHQQEKLDALRSGLVSSANPENISEDLVFQFFRYIDDLSVTHIRMLSAFRSNSESFSEFEKMEQVYEYFKSHLSIVVERSIFRSFIHDLNARSLIDTGDLDDFSEYESMVVRVVASSSQKRPLSLTELGRSFLQFIQNDCS